MILPRFIEQHNSIEIWLAQHEIVPPVCAEVENDSELKTCGGTLTDAKYNRTKTKKKQKKQKKK
eukprot:15316141-Ditylum_brightwellii.AAC.1